MWRQLQFSEEFPIDALLFYDAVVQSTDDYIYVVDLSTDRALVSQNMARDFGLPGGVFPGLIPLWGAMVHERDREPFHRNLQYMLDGHTDEHRMEYQVRNLRGEYVWVSCRGKLQRGGDGTAILFAGVVTDLSLRGKLDGVTGLFTQQKCRRVVTEFLESGASAGMLLLGLDNFSRINNLEDHVFGDNVLRQFAQAVQAMLPRGFTIYRFDGDEFAVVAAGQSAEQFQGLYDQILDYASREHELDGIRYYCTVSGGIAVSDACDVDYRGLLKCASGAMELSKQNGKQRCTVFAPEKLKGNLRRLELYELLRGCVLDGMQGFHVVYQPLTTAHGMSLGGAEALLRWAHPAVGRVSPVEFIPILEDNGMIVSGGKWVLEQAVATCKKWQSSLPGFCMNVNVSFLQVQDRKFVSIVRQLLQRYDLDPKCLVLELTEGRFVTDIDLLNSTFAQLRQMGVGIAMDDFGTGYSSLGLLCDTPVDVIKIDRAFITRIGDNDRSFNRDFIASVIQLCHSVGINVCVEGVEEQEELDTVRGLAADCIQGYYVSQPLTAEEFEAQFISRAEAGQCVIASVKTPPMIHAVCC